MELNKGGEIVLIRIISALIAIPLLLFIVAKNGIILKVAVLVVTIIAINEFFSAFENLSIIPSKSITIFSSVALFIITLKSADANLIMFWFFVNMFLVLSSSLFKKEFNVIVTGVTVIGIYYIVFFMYHIVFLVNLGRYNQLIWLIFITAWATDTFAYFTGYFLGKHKLCPNISPKKTVEGAIGGIVGSVLMSIVFSSIFAPKLLLDCIIIGFLGSVFGQIGDLIASLFKRYVGIKDYGKIMPGHGGILDRFDSILFTAPTVYYYIILFIK